MGVKVRATSRLHELALAALVCWLALFAASAARAAYWTIPVNYYALETNRYPLAITGTLTGKLPNLGPRGRMEDAASIAAGRLVGETDEERGLVGDFNPTDGAVLVYPYPTSAQADRRASLSLWMKLKNLDDQVIAARGDQNAGFTLQLTGGKLSFIYWEGQNRSRLLSSKPLNASAWYNVILTQSTDAAPQGAYAAMYLNDILQDFSRTNMPGGGLLAGASSTNGVIGSASTSGLVYSSGYQPYQRANSDKAPIFGVTPFASAFLGEYRLFYGMILVCSDKTAKNPLNDNVNLQLGTRCPVTSDISSIAQDRIEQASYRARLPFQLDYQDHNFVGLNTGNKPACKNCPAFERDNLRVRQDVAKFGGNQRVEYAPTTSPLSLHRFKPPYSVAMWVKIPEQIERAHTVYSVGNISNPKFEISGLNIETLDDEIVATVWDGACKTSSMWAEGIGPTLHGWHHIAVSYDAPRAGDPTEEPNGLQVFVDGTMVASSKVRKAVAWPEEPVTIGMMGPGGGCARASSVPFYVQGFRGYVSEVKVLDAPITAVQAQQLASRYPDAYKPRMELQSYGYTGQPAEASIPKVEKHTYSNFVPSFPNQLWVPNSPVPSINLRFTVDWSQPGKKWTGYAATPVSDPDCEYMLGGVFWYRAEVEPEEAASAFLCFSPTKINQHIPPFSIGLFYPAYQKSLFLTVVDPMMPEPVLRELYDYSEAHGVAGIKTDVNLDIGAYNMVLQMATRADQLFPKDSPVPNYVSPLYEGLGSLVRQAFYWEQNEPKSRQVTFVWPAAVDRIDARYLDQRQLLDEFDMKLSKDR